MLKGFIIFLNKEKRYGKIKSSHGPQYKFDFSDFKSSDIDFLKTDIKVFFEEKSPTRAAKCFIDYSKPKLNEEKFEVPSDIFWSKESKIKGWEILEKSRWSILESGRGDPSSVKDALKRRAKQLNANSIVNIRYFSTTGSESGTGNGTHHFTIHNFEGTPVNIGKKSTRGKFKKDILSNIDNEAEELKLLFNKEYDASKKHHHFFGFLIFLFACFYYLFHAPWDMFVGIVGSFISFAVFSGANDNGYWLNKK